ncbi:colanic acid biosynthesis protein [Aureliella helgolandensis]|uniref:Colanic acid biosynthesis protein n=2 Tax=Aureliella helgolandensis TaxID=2527968 RepID=A0A518GFF9_9BACT|nr:colanic acid biosynthesis protein [Aureliella helgolandensis]
MLQLVPETRFVVFDYGLKTRSSTFTLANGTSVEIELRGARGGRRYDRVENLATMYCASRLGSLGKLLNTNVAAIDQCDAVLDVSGGDSFSDIYGSRRFYDIVYPKLIAIQRKIPLFLLPQTYGPFQGLRFRELAARAVRGAEMCWARDQHSFQILQELLGDRFDPANHRCGVDLAFGLEPRPAPEVLSVDLQRMLELNRQERPLVGFNISGLIYNDPVAAAERYGFKADYHAVVRRFLTWLLSDTDANVVLVSHVISPAGHYESDPGACQAMADELQPQFPGRIVLSPSTLDQSQLKWLIGQTDWFCGTRMHATIAALSSGVPTATVSYSDKALGVFESCGQGGAVIDPRVLETEQVLEQLTDAYQNRASARQSLSQHLPKVLGQAREQLDCIVERIRSAAQQRHRCEG